MGFKKAMPSQVYMKASMYGPQGSGKTFTSLLFAERLAEFRGKRIAFVDTENGTKGAKQRVPGRPVHPEAFDFDVLYTRSMSVIDMELRALDPTVHGIVVIDSLSHVWDASREAWQERNPDKKTIPVNAWDEIKRPYRKIMRWIVESQFDVFILGRQRNVFEEDDDGKLRTIGVAMRAEGETQHEPDWCFRMFNVGDPGGEVLPAIFCEKDRFGILQGRTVSAPSGPYLDAVLPFLGSDAPQAEDENARLAADGEMFDERTDKTAKKVAGSVVLFEEFQPRLRSCTTLDELVSVAADLKKQKRHLIDGHIGALRVIYEARRDDLVRSKVPEV